MASAMAGRRVSPLSLLVLLFSQLFLQTTAVPVFNTEDSHADQVLLGGVDNSPFSSTPIENDRSSAVYAEEDVEASVFPSWLTSTLQARRLLALSTSGVVSTIFPESGSRNVPSPVAGQSISLREYVADCDEELPTGNGGDGSPTFLALNVGTTFRNTAAGSNVSLELDWWEHLDETDPLFPGAPLSAAALPRVTLFGYIEHFPEPISKEDKKALRSCYLASHPDAVVWLPDQPLSPHASFWAKMVVTQVYWIGGFGNMARIGWMDVDLWQGIRRKGSDSVVGDGRGWEDVRLPGEKE